jgi:hypothetical protein
LLLAEGAQEAHHGTFSDIQPAAQLGNLGVCGAFLAGNGEREVADLLGGESNVDCRG